MSIHNAATKLGVAVDALALPHISLRERLVYAWTQGLFYVDPNDLPDETRREFEELVAEITAKPPSGREGTIHSTLREMDDAQLDNLARRIRGLAHAAELEADRLDSLRRPQ